MSTTIIDGKEYLNSNVVETFLCAACHGPLREVWGKTREEDKVVCRRDPDHKGFISAAGVEYRERERRLERREMAIQDKRESIQETALATSEEQVEEWYKRMQRFPIALPQDEAKIIRYAAARMAVVYGLDPFLRELILIPQKKDKRVVDYALYASIEGMRRAARRTGEYQGRELRPATKKEREALHITDKNVHVWRCDAFRKGYERPFEAYGVFPMLAWDERSKAPPWRMARKRAEHAALRAAFGLNLPLFEPEAPEEEVIEAEAIELGQPVREVVAEAAARVEEIIEEMEEDQAEQQREVLQTLIDEAKEHGVADEKIVAALEATTLEEEVEAEEALKEELYGPIEEKPPSIALFWSVFNAQHDEVVSLKEAEAILKEHKPVLEAIEALRSLMKERTEAKLTGQPAS